MLASVPDFSSPHSAVSERLFPAFCLALLLHAALIVLFWPWLKHTESGGGAPVRIVVEMAQIVEQESQPEPVQTVLPEPEPVTEPVATEPEQSVAKAPDNEQPILIARDDTPVEPEDMIVPEQAKKVVDEKVVQTPPEQPEPLPEPQKIEPPEPKPKPEPKVLKIEKPKQEPDPVVATKDIPAESKHEDIKQAFVPKDVTVPTPSAISSSPNSSNEQASVSQSHNKNETDSNVQSQEADRDEAWKGYGQLLYAMVSKNKIYPQLAIRRQLEGVVLVSARFKQGKLVEVLVLEPGSGHKILDTAALNMLEKAVEQLPVRGDLSKKSFTVVVPVDFRLTS